MLQVKNCWNSQPITLFSRGYNYHICTGQARLIHVNTIRNIQGSQAYVLKSNGLSNWCYLLRYRDSAIVRTMLVLSFIFVIVWSFWVDANLCKFFIVYFYQYCGWRSIIRWGGLGSHLPVQPCHIFVPVPRFQSTSHCLFPCSMVPGKRWLFVLLILVELLITSV